MKAWIRQMALGLALSAGALGCSNKDAATAVAQQAVIPDREVIAYIPQNTPYLWMGFESLPQPLRDFGEELYKALSLQDLYQEMFAELFPDDPAVKSLTSAGLAEIKEERFLQKIGLSPDFRTTIYGLGLMPVVRIEVQDEAKARAFLKRIAESQGQPWPEKKLGDQTYFEGGDADVTVALALVKKELVLAIVPKALAEKFLKIAFLQEKPENAFKDMSALKTFARDFGLRYGMGYIDFQKMFDHLRDDRAQGLWGEFVRSVSSDAEPLPEGCAEEISKMWSKTPRIVFGLSDRISDKRLDFKFGLEFEANAAKDLLSIAHQGLGMAPKGKLLTLSLGLDLPKTVDYLQKKIAEMYAEPHRCALLQDSNLLSESLSELKPLLAKQTFADLKAVSLAVDEFSLLGQISGSAMAVHEHPEALLESLQGFGVSGLDLKPDSQIVDLPPLPGVPPSFKLRARMTSNAIGLSMGENQDLSAFMASKGEPGVLANFGFSPKLIGLGSEKFLGVYVKEARERRRQKELSLQAELKKEMGDAWAKHYLNANDDERLKKLQAAHPEMTPEQLVEAFNQKLLANDGDQSFERIMSVLGRIDMMRGELKLTPKGVMSEWGFELKPTP